MGTGAEGDDGTPGMTDGRWDAWQYGRPITDTDGPVEVDPIYDGPSAQQMAVAWRQYRDLLRPRVGPDGRVAYLAYEETHEVNPDIPASNASVAEFCAYYAAAYEGYRDQLRALLRGTQT